MASVQFPARKPLRLGALEKGLRLHDPTETFADTMTLVDGARLEESIDWGWLGGLSKWLGQQMLDLMR